MAPGSVRWPFSPQSPTITRMIHNIADINPNGSSVALASARTPANYVIISAPSGNAADLRVGDQTTSAASGIVVGKGLSVTLWPIADDLYLDLALIRIYGAAGTDKAGVVYGVH